MEMEVIMPSPPTDSNYDSASTSPYISASSSPQRFNTLFYSAPASPIHFSSSSTRSLSAIPFNWEQKPGISKTNISTATSSNYGDADESLEEIDFAFDFSGQLEKGSLSAADELFDRGKIKPLTPPPRFQYDQNRSLDSPKSPRSPKKLIKEAFSPHHKKKEFNRFDAAAKQTRKEVIQETDIEIKQTEKSSPRNKSTRSLSMFRVSDLLFDPEFNQEEPAKISSSVWYKKWSIRNLLLFRSASESRVTEQNQAQKYALFKKTQQDDMKNLSFRSIDTVASSASLRRKTGPPVSPHELHYTANRAVSEEMKKRTFLPYKQGVLGCLKFRSSAHEMSRGTGPAGSMSRG